MSNVSVLMLPDTGSEIEVVGNPVRGDGYFGYQDGLHTISIKVSSFIGRVHIEGTLVLEPSEDDWFPIYLDGCNPYIDFPLDPRDPSSDVVTIYNRGGDTTTVAYSFEGNFVWLRARVSRENVKIPLEYKNPEDIGRFLGAVSRILLNH